MRKNQPQRLAAVINNSVRKIKYPPQNSMIQINKTALKKTFDRYRFNFYPTSDYDIDEINKKLLEALILLFSQDEFFLKTKVCDNTPGLDKGVFVYGNVGTGKTDFFTIFRRVAFDYVQLHNYSKLNFHEIHAGHFVIEYGKFQKMSPGDCQYFYDKHLNGKLLIDDLGTEPTHYGQEIVKQLILDRYRRWKQNRDIVTMITTNKDLDELEARYGDQVPDRILEMCNVIHWPGESRRN